MSKKIIVALTAFNLLALCPSSFAQNAALVAPVAPMRTLHVAPQTLPNVAPGAQFRTVGEAAKVVVAGDTVVIHTGVYRESVAVENSGTKARPIRFVAAPGARVMLTGADQFTDWRKEGEAAENLYSTAWNHNYNTFNPPREGKPLNPNDIIMRSEQVFVQDYALTQVPTRAALSRGTFWIDYENKRLYAWGSSDEKLPGRRVDVAVRRMIWQTTGEYIQVKGLRFRYAANLAQKGAALFQGRGGLIEDCVFERTNSVGAAFRAPEQTIRRCIFQDNGQMGWGAGVAHDSLMSGCITRNNNIKNYRRAWEAGGDKISRTRNLVIENSQFLDNRGTGIWFDISNENCTIRNCLIANNEDAGIFYEISYSLRAHDNVIIGNGFAESPGAWGANGGLSLSSSPNCVIERNLMIGNKEGLQFREQKRTTPILDAPRSTPEIAIWNHDSTVRNNVFAFNRDAGLWGWFDTKEEAHWPRSMQTPATQAGADANANRPAEDMAADYAAKGQTTKPKDLSLETLHLTLQNNLYVPGEDARIFRWGPAWSRNKSYTELAPVQRELNLEQGSVVTPFEFADFATLDLRVSADSPLLKMGAYPRGEVPGVKLGVLPLYST